MRTLIAISTLALILPCVTLAGNVYKITPHNQAQAEQLKIADVDVLLWVPGGYLVMGEENSVALLKQSGLGTELLAADVARDELYMDKRPDRKNAEKFDLIYEVGQLRLLRITADRLAEFPRSDVFPLRKHYVKIEYRAPSVTALEFPEADYAIDIAALIAQVDQDSLQAYVEHLQSYEYRLAGTQPNYEARDWIADKFESWGYSPLIDPFIGRQLWSYGDVQCYNIIATKTGTRYPLEYVIIGGHFDVVPYTPGADDNGTGTAAVLEIARVMKDVETDRTVIFVTFDSEESGLRGAYHYVEDALARGDDIVVMYNADMIAHENNHDRADLYHGAENAFAVLWNQMAGTYGLNLIGDLSTAGGSDEAAFRAAGFDAVFVQEKNFSTHYHLASDSTVYLNFEYMSRMVKATLASLISVSQSLRPIRPLAVRQTGDGQSLQVHWPSVDNDNLAGYRLCYYGTDPVSSTQSVAVAASDTSWIVQGLTEGNEYAFYVQAIDDEGNESVPNYGAMQATPTSVPQRPENVTALPIHTGISISWTAPDLALDFDHYAVIRDGVIIEETMDTEYIDIDAALETQFHRYHVVAVDNDGTHSDTVGIEPTETRAASLDDQRILAVNRSGCCRSMDLVDEVMTGEFLRQALTGYNYDYYSDTAAITHPTDTPQLDLVDMIDYGLLIIGSETARYDDIGVSPYTNGLLDTLAYYLSIGGRAIVFGRWGTTYVNDTIDYITNPYAYDDAYHDYLHIDQRVQTLTDWVLDTLQSDMIGAASNTADYPDLPWDSAITLTHSRDGTQVVNAVSGIPCVSFADLTPGDAEVLYTYDSRDNDPHNEGKPVGWRYLGDDYSYVFFELPLSFMQRSAAIDALRNAISDLTELERPEGDNEPDNTLPQSFVLNQNFPNPFNPGTTIRFRLPEPTHVLLTVYNILGQQVATIVDEQLPAGTHDFEWDGSRDDGKGAATGIYLYRMKAGDYIESKKMLLLK